jgi:DNA-binding MarR family transcriptional regulator
MKALLPVPGPRYEALLQLLHTAETLWNASRAFFTRWDLSPSQFNVLNLLCEEPAGCSQTELSRRLIMHRSNVTGLVDRLEKRGLVVRRANPADRRAWFVLLAPPGRRLLNEILPVYYAAAEQVWGDVPVRRARALADDLERLSRNAHAIAVQSDPS